MGSGVSKKCRDNQTSPSESEIGQNSPASKPLSKSDSNLGLHQSEHPRDFSVNPRLGSKVNCSNFEDSDSGSARDVHAVVCNLPPHDDDKINNNSQIITEKEVEEEVEKLCQPKPTEEEIATEKYSSNKAQDLHRSSATPSVFNENFNKFLSEKDHQNKKMSTDSNKAAEQQRMSTSRTDSTLAKDIMISYSHKDTDMMMKCRGKYLYVRQNLKAIRPISFALFDRLSLSL